MHIPKNNSKFFRENGQIDTGEMIAFLEHLDHCDFCLEQMLEEESRTSSARAPEYLSGEIMTRAAAPDIQASKIITDTSRRIQFFYYGLRTAAGVLAALVLLFCVCRVDFSSVLSPPGERTAEITTEWIDTEPASGLHHLSDTIGAGISKGSGKLADYLGSFPNKIFRGGE